MQPSEAYLWVKQAERRQNVLIRLTQPMTANQLARQTRLSRDCCSAALWELATHRLTTCLNPHARSSRLYWLTQQGKTCQRRLYRERGLGIPVSLLPDLDWALYGWVCFRHRATVIRALTEPLQPAAIKHRARARDPNVRLSANNVRDVIRLFAAKGIVRPVRVRRKAHLRYELTELGLAFQRLLVSAEAMPSHQRSVP